MTRYYIGLANTYHDSALSIVDAQGQVIFAEGTERYLQNKRAFHCPADQYARIGRVLTSRGADVEQLVVASSWSAAYHARLTAQLAQPTAPLGGSAFERALGSKLNFIDRSQASAQPTAGLGLQCWLAENRPTTRLEQRAYEHHLVHAAAACYTSPFSSGVCAVLDGFGEDTSANFYRYDGGRIEEIQDPSKRPSGASLGMFYGLLCMMCGFDMHEGEEWKVMGMAPYGSLHAELYQLFDRLITIDGLTIDRGDMVTFAAFFEDFERARAAGHPRISPADVAYTGQRVYEEKLFQLLGNLHRLGISDHLLLGGGCGLNSTANGMITSRTPFRSLFVGSAPADDGNALGAALLAYHTDHPADAETRTRPGRTQSPYLGSTMSPQTLEQLQRFGGLRGLQRCEDVAERTAELLASGKIIGWVQGPAEFGPRALGNRSILADPRRPDIKDEINARVKFREEFRPFAPSILHEHGDEYFENYQETPYMERTLMFRDSVKQRVPGVVHVNGSGRLQTVKKEWNERYYQLVRAFARRTGVPIVLNTSFNIMGKPIIHSVEDALAVFFTTGLDALVIENWLLLKDDDTAEAVRRRS